MNGYHHEWSSVEEVAPCGCIAYADGTGVPCLAHHPDTSHKENHMTDTSNWEYTIRLGHATESDKPVCVFQIIDGEDVDAEPLLEGYADDMQGAITFVAEAILNVHDDMDAA